MTDPTNAAQSIPNQLAAICSPVEVATGAVESDRVLGRLYRAPEGAALTFWWPAICFAAMAVVAALEGNFLVRGGLDQVLADLKQIKMLEDATSANPFFPMLRDYPSLLLTAVSSVSIPIVRGLLISITRMTRGELNRDRRLLVWHSKLSKSALYSARLGRRLMKLRTISPWIFLACLVIGINFSISQDQGGMHYYFAPDDASASWDAIDGYKNWWASPRSPFRAASILWIVVGSVGTYAACVGSLVGWVTVLYLRSLARREALALDLFNKDGHYGLAMLRSAFAYGAAASGVLAFGLVGVLYLVAPFSPSWLVMSIGLIGLAHNGGMAGAAMYYSRKSIGSAKFNMKKAIQGTSGDPGDAAAVLELIDKIPQSPIRPIATVTSVITFLTAAASVVGMIAGN